MPKIFIAHSWEDNDTSRIFAENLQRDGCEIWIDYARISGEGYSLPKRIANALEWCDTLLLIWSQSASKSYYVQIEWQAALDLKKLIIPCIIDRSEMPALLTMILYIDFSKFDKGYAQLIRALGLSGIKEHIEASRQFIADAEIYHKSIKPRNNIFISYCHRDTSWLERLRVHLKPIERDMKVDVWDDRRIRVGSKWREEVSRALSAARIAILLTSADFLASDFIMSDEVPPLLSAAKSEGAIILPIILSPCLFLQIESLSQYQAVNDPTRPIIALNEYEQEKIFLEVALIIREFLLNVDKF
jgi:hypothetical protein